MDVDEDVFVVIIGDEDEDEDEEESYEVNIEIKQEIKEEPSNLDDMENLFEAVEKHGEFLDIGLNIKEEVLDEDLKELADDDYVPDAESSDDENVDLLLNVEEFTKQRRAMVKPHQRKSLVRELLRNYKELQNDEELLIETLCEMMRNARPPSPPQDFFLMNGIMFECVFCDHLSNTMPAASRHYQEKHGERYLRCYACGVDFRSKTNLYKHEMRCNAPDAMVVLKARARFVGRKGRSRPFLLAKQLAARKIVRSEKKQFVCESCPAAFSSAAGLTAHRLLHDGARPFRCEHCPAAYTSRSTLFRHLSKHKDDEYICDHCERSFKLKTSLVAHMNTHLPEKKFGCEECDQRFAQKLALRLHVNRVHRLLPPPCACNMCPRRFPRMSSLKNHMLKVHGMRLMTRNMFFKSLPMMSEIQLKKAKVVLKSEVHEFSNINSYDYANEKKRPRIKTKKADKELINVKMNGADGKKNDQDATRHEGTDAKATEEAIDNEESLSKEVMYYIEQLQKECINDVETRHVVTIEDDQYLRIGDEGIVIKQEGVQYNNDGVIEGRVLVENCAEDDSSNISHIELSAENVAQVIDNTE